MLCGRSCSSFPAAPRVGYRVDSPQEGTAVSHTGSHPSNNLKVRYIFRRFGALVVSVALPVTWERRGARNMNLGTVFDGHLFITNFYRPGLAPCHSHRSDPIQQCSHDNLISVESIYRTEQIQ